MVMQLTPQEIKDRYDSWKAERDTWLKYANENYDYYMNDVENTHTIYTVKQFEKIKNTTNIPVTINWLYPTVSQKLAIMSQSKPSHKVVSVDGRAKDEAVVLDKICKHILYSSIAKTQNKEALKNALITGLGHRIVIPDSIFEPGAFGLAIETVPADEVIVDANIRNATFNDMEGFFLEKELTLTKFAAVYGFLLDELTDSQGNPITLDFLATSSDSIGARVGIPGIYKKIVLKEYFDLVYSNMYLVVDPTTNAKKKIFRENLAEGTDFILEGAEGVPGVYVRKWIIVGDYVLKVETLPLTKLPLDTYVFEWGGRPYKSYGMVHFAKGMQEAFDKIIQLLILNGILSNNSSWRSPEGGISDTQKATWEQHGNDPTVVKFYNPITIGSQVLAPEKDQPQQLSNFYPMIAEMLRNGIERSTGITPVIGGDTSQGKVDVFSSLQQYHQAGMQRIMMAINDVNISSTKLGNVLVEYIANTLEPDKYYFFFDENGDFNEFQVAKNIIDNMYLSKYAVISIEADMMPSQRLATATELFKVAQTSTDPYERKALWGKAMELSDIKGTEKIQETLDSVRQLQGTIQQMTDQIDRDKELLKQYENRALNAEYQQKLLEKVVQGIERITKAETKVVTELEMKQQQEKNKEKESS